VSEVAHRRLGVDLFNDVWTLLEKDERTQEEDDLMLHRAHASTYHWLVAPECKPENRARGEWICSRVYSVLRRAEPALHHATRCVQICEQHGIGDFDIAFAHEAVARAHLVGGDEDEARRWARSARELARAIAEDDDRELLERDLASLP
jgi:hypothetical protein